jgi:hypothetical protein
VSVRRGWWWRGGQGAIMDEHVWAEKAKVSISETMEMLASK